MKYGKLNNGTLDTKEVEKGIEVKGNLTEEELIKDGYKPICEIEKPSNAETFTYREYESCFVQEWSINEENNIL